MATPSSYRPRQKKKFPPTAYAPGSNNDLVLDPGTPRAAPMFPLVSFLWAARGGTSQWLILPLILMVVGLYRWAVSLWGYSGFQRPPMHGDFEAQRHWMEITIHLPISMWYFYDLQYWGLDYPPLTAYHSWLLGKIGSALDPLWFALDESRGLEDPLLKVYMRATVIISEYLIYIPAIIVFLRRYSRLNGVPTWSGSVALVAILLQPSTILIDHGHFQYNTVMLGLVVATLESILAGRLLSACVFFVAALGFKQMALYYAPIVFAFLLGKCFVPRFRILLLLSIAITTIAAFAMLFAPLLVGSFYDWYHGLPLSVPLPPLVQSLPVTLEGNSWYYAPIVQVSQVIHRIFPFSRGIFEDKVANAWCAIHTFVKLHRFPTTVLQRASLGFTLLSILVPCAAIFRNPRPALLPLALASAAWGFFLFSFQVHEKSVLLPLLPMTLLLGGDSGLSKETRAWVGWANMIAVWTIYPLFKREDLCVPYFVVTLLWAYLLGLPPVSLEVYRARSLSKNSAPSSELHFITKFLHLLFYLSMVVWHVLEAAVPPPADKPDLWVVLNVLIGASGLCIIYLWCTWRLVVQIYGTAYRWPEEESKLKPS